MQKKTKIVATVGPASESKEMLLALARAGVNVFRLNFSHGTHADHLIRIQRIREINQEHNLQCAILQDLQGPKIRVGMMENGNDGVEIIAGNQLIFTSEEIVGNAQKVSTPYKGMYKDINIGDRILMDDGKLEVKVIGIEGTDVVTEVVYGGKLKQKKGVNLPNTAISMPSVTDKDWEDLKFGLANDVDWVALSFVRTAEEILDIKEHIRKEGKHTKVIAKVERPEAVYQNMDAIIDATDAIMVARGDLGVELPSEEVPMIQKLLVQKSNLAAKPVIVATQMLESMIDSPRPTRAEVNDIANAVLDGADAVMLSAESASGKYPLESVQTMTETILNVETNSEKLKRSDDPKQHPIFFHHHTRVSDPNYQSNDKENDNVVMNACRLARDLKVKAIIGITTSGYTAYRLSHHRPQASLFAFTSNKLLLNQLSLYWGVQAYHYEQTSNSVDATVDKIREFLVEQGELAQGDYFINTLSMPLQQNNRTNTIKLSKVE